MINKEVWHPQFGKGIIVENYREKTRYEIKFESGIKSIRKDEWSKHLFLTEEDMKCEDKNAIKEKYDEIIRLKTSKNYRQRVQSLDNKLLLNDLEDRVERNIVIILNRQVEKNRQKFLFILGIDIFTCKVVKIIDNYGKKYGLHTFNEELSDIKNYSVIKANFKICNENNSINGLRITSKFILIGQSNLEKLLNKYRIFSKNFIVSFNDAFDFASLHKDKTFYIIVNFTDTLIKQYIPKPGRKKYQLKMSHAFVDIEDTDIDIENKVGQHFKGWGIISIIKKGYKSCVIAHSLSGKFHADKEWNIVIEKQKGKIDLESKNKYKYSDCYKNEGYEDGGNSKYEEDYYYLNDEEYGDYETYEAIHEEMQSGYEEYESETFDEYSENQIEYNSFYVQGDMDYLEEQRQLSKIVEDYYFDENEAYADDIKFIEKMNIEKNKRMEQQLFEVSDIYDDIFAINLKKIKETDKKNNAIEFNIENNINNIDYYKDL